MRIMENILGRFTTANELLQYFLHHKWWWLTPMVFMLLLFGALIIFTQSSAIAPFIYTLF